MLEFKNPYGFIYITTNMTNGKRYIGQKRFINGWKNYLGSGVVFLKAIKKYGKESFIRDIVDIAYSRKELDNKEIQWINSYNAIDNDNYYNIASGGHNSNTFAGKTDEEMYIIKSKKSKSTTGKLNPFFGKHHSEESKLKISNANKGVLCGENNPMYGKHHTDYAKDKIKQTRINKGLNREVYQLDKETFKIIKKWDSIAQATKELGLSRSSIKNVLSEKTSANTAGGFCWEYVDKENIKYKKQRSVCCE